MVRVLQASRQNPNGKRFDSTDNLVQIGMHTRLHQMQDKTVGEVDCFVLRLSRKSTLLRCMTAVVHNV